MGESVVWAPGRSGGAARMTAELAYHCLSRIVLFRVLPAASARSMNSLIALRRRRHERQDARVVHARRADDADRPRRLPVRRVGRPHDGELPAAELARPPRRRPRGRPWRSIARSSSFTSCSRASSAVTRRRTSPASWNSGLSSSRSCPSMTRSVSLPAASSTAAPPSCERRAPQLVVLHALGLQAALEELAQVAERCAPRPRRRAGCGCAGAPPR